MGFSKEITELRQTPDARFLRRSIWAITGLFVLMIVVNVVSDALHHQRVLEIEHYAEGINLAGRQRMLTQRIAYLSEVLVTSRSDAMRLNSLYELGNTAREMRDERDDLLLLVPLEPSLQRLYHEAPVWLARRVDDYTAAALDLAQVDFRTVAVTHPQYQLISASASRLLSDLEAVVTAYQYQLSGAMLELSEMNRGRVMFIIGGLTVMGLFILFPGIRTLRRYIGLLYQHATTLNQKIHLMEERQAFIEAMMASIASPLAVYDIPSGKTVFINERYRQMLGYEESDGMVHSLYNLDSVVHEEDLERAQMCMLKAAQTGIPTLGEYRLRRKDGGYVVVESRAAALYQQGKILNPPQLVALMRPIDGKFSASKEVSFTN